MRGHFVADGLTFTARDPAQGWDGIRFESGSGGSIADALVDGGGIAIDGSSPTISNTLIQNGPGVSITGAASPILTGNTIQDNSHGVSLAFMAQGHKATLDDNTILLNDHDGIYALSSTVYLTRNEIGRVDEANGGTGVVASLGSTLLFRPPTGGAGANVVTFNTGGGVRAEGDYTSVQAGTLRGSNLNSFHDNGQPGPQWFDLKGPDAESYTGALLTARSDWWGRPSSPDTTSGVYGGCDVFDPDCQVGGGSGYPHSGNGVLYVDPMLDTAPGGGASAMTASGGTLTGDALGGARPTEAGGNGQTDEGTPGSARRQLLAASEAAEREDWRGAFDLLRTAGAAPEVAGRVALSQMARLCGPEQNVQGGVAADAEAFLRSLGEPAARPLLACLVASGQDAEALALAESLSSEGLDARGSGVQAPGVRPQEAGADALYGQMMAFYVHLRAGDAVQANQALTHAQALAPRARSVAVATSALAVSRGAAPEAVVQVAEPSGVRTASSTVSEPAAGFTLDDLRPNPTTTSAVVPFRLASPASVTVEAYDVLGRQVARVESSYEAGPHGVTLDVSGLPAGVYLVRATVTSDSGPATVQVRSLTVAR